MIKEGIREAPVPKEQPDRRDKSDKRIETDDYRDVAKPTLLELA